MSILNQGTNCWRIARAKRVAFLIDGATYFNALKEAICCAKETILVLGWDIGDNATLRGEEHPVPDNQFVELLSSCVQNRSGLNVYLLNWDYAVVYVRERRLFPALNWNIHPRIHFHEDSRHPPMGSHHQKIVVVDDSVAFVGGFDITPGRWDTRKHLAHDPRRLNAKGKIHSPIHDVQIAVEGDPAALLGSMARTRWARATGTPVPVGEGESNVWPEHIQPHLTDVDVAISRTIPADENGNEVREVEKLYVDSIEAAKKFIYVENQYFTSSKVTEALARRLSEKDGPEVVLVLHRNYSGIMEGATMGLLRKRVIAVLSRADRFHRLGIFYPLHKREDVSINVHSKIMVVDDEFVRVGSSNLSNRSMGLDTECDVAIEANGHEEHKNAIIRFRNGLLAEHLGSSLAEVTRKIGESGSLLHTVHQLRNDIRTLEPIIDRVPEWMENLIPANPFFDPDRAIPFHQRLFRWATNPKVLLGIATLVSVSIAFKGRKRRKK
jgi:phospholipase D1/2